MPTIKQTREKSGLTGERFGKLIGMTRHRISNIESGVGRQETKIHKHFLLAIELIMDNGLLGELEGMVEEYLKP